MYFTPFPSRQYTSIFLFVSIVVLMTTQACEQIKILQSSTGLDQGRAEDHAETAIPVEVARLTKGSIRHSVKAVAVLMPQEKASVRSLISGLIKEIYVREGDHVKAQQRLAQISRPGAKSLIQKAISAYQKARRDVKQVKKLVKKGLAPKDELAQAKFNRDQTGLELVRLRSEAKNEKVTTPIDGVIVNRSIYRGETISPGQAMFEIMDLSTVYAPLKLPDRWSTKINEGMTASLFDREGQLTEKAGDGQVLAQVVLRVDGRFAHTLRGANPTAPCVTNTRATGLRVDKRHTV